MTEQTSRPAEITRRAIEVLTRELGPADAARSLGQSPNSIRDYTVERERLLSGKSLDQIIADIEAGPTGGVAVEALTEDGGHVQR